MNDFTLNERAANGEWLTDLNFLSLFDCSAMYTMRDWLEAATYHVSHEYKKEAR